MTNIKVDFFHQEWDNHQGGQGKIIEMSKSIIINEDIFVSDIKETVINYFNKCGYNDDWSESGFTGRGLINISILT